MKRLIGAIGLIIIGALSVPLIRAHMHHNQVVYHTQGVALEGYDVVSYFTKSQPQKGLPQYAVPLGGITYWFENQLNQQLFAQDPTRYLPQYGAWCATAMASGKRVRPIPTNYEVRDGRLYLFFEFLGINPKHKWAAKLASYQGDADRSYQELISKSQLSQ